MIIFYGEVEHNFGGRLKDGSDIDCRKQKKKEAIYEAASRCVGKMIEKGNNRKKTQNDENMPTRSTNQKDRRRTRTKRYKEKRYDYEHQVMQDTILINSLQMKKSSSQDRRTFLEDTKCP